jgi:hypothetical protein
MALNRVRMSRQDGPRIVTWERSRARQLYDFARMSTETHRGALPALYADLRPSPLESLVHGF